MRFRPAPTLLGGVEETWRVEEGVRDAAAAYMANDFGWIREPARIWLEGGRRDRGLLFLDGSKPRLHGNFHLAAHVSIPASCQGRDLHLVQQPLQSSTTTCCFAQGIFVTCAESRTVCAVHALADEARLTIPAIGDRYPPGREGSALHVLGIWCDERSERGPMVLWGDSEARGWEEVPALPDAARGTRTQVSAEEFLLDGSLRRFSEYDIRDLEILMRRALQEGLTN